MVRAVLGVCALLLAPLPVRAADPKPLWEIDVGGAHQATSGWLAYPNPLTIRETAPSGATRTTPGWLAYSPDGKAIVAVVVRETTGVPREYQYRLHVWDAATRKERFTADLGTSKTPHWGDDLATFPTNDTIMTGGQSETVRSLEDGKQTSALPTGGVADHAVWAVPDLQESYFLRREPGRHGLPAELLHRTPATAQDQLVNTRSRFGAGPTLHQTTIPVPRAGLQTEAIAMNPGRTRLAVAYRDETPVSNPRHVLVTYLIRTHEEFELQATSEAVNPHPGPVSALAFARNGKTLATGGEDGSVSLWDTNDAGSLWKPRATVAGASDHRVYAIAFSPDWRSIAAVTWDRTKPNLLLIDVDSGKLIRAVRMERELLTVTFSWDGRTLLTGSGTGKIRAWDVAALLGN